MRKKSLIIAAIATLGISVCMGTAETSFAAENNAITLESEDAFGDGSENTEEFSAGEGQEENAAAFQYNIHVSPPFRVWGLRYFRVWDYALPGQPCRSCAGVIVFLCRKASSQKLLHLRGVCLCMIPEIQFLLHNVL